MHFNEALVSTQDHILVAVSGGADSMVLLDILAKQNHTLTVAHFNHQIRGQQATHDAEFVRTQANQRGLAFVLGMKDVPHFAQEHALSLEDAARICRYQFLKNTAQEIQASKIAIAHNHNDQTETIIMRFLRGTAGKGLCGMQETRMLDDIPIIRPLLNTSRQDIEAYTQKHNIPFCHDETNDETIFMRNKLRHEIIPKLKEINPNLDETIARMANIFTEEEQYWENITTETLKTLIITQDTIAIKLDQPSLTNQPKALQRRIIRKAIESLQGSLHTISLLYIENFLENQLNTLYINERGELQGKKS